MVSDGAGGGLSEEYLIVTKSALDPVDHPVTNTLPFPSAATPAAESQSSSPPWRLVHKGRPAPEYAMVAKSELPFVPCEYPATKTLPLPPTAMLTASSSPWPGPS